MGRLAERLNASVPVGIGEMTQKLSANVDEEFRTHCRVVLTNRDRLRIHVDHPALVYSMRAKWLRCLGAAASNRCFGAGVREIEFAYGTEGAALPAPASAR